VRRIDTPSSSVTGSRAATGRHLRGLVVAVLVLGACSGSTGSSIDVDLDQSLDEVVAAMRVWSDGQSEWTWTDGVEDNYVGGLAYGMCLTLEQNSVEQVKEILIKQADGDTPFEDELLYMLALSRVKVCSGSG